MPRGTYDLRTAQVLLLAVSAIMLVSIVAIALFAEGPPEDWGIEWREPSSVTVDEVEADEANERFLFTIHLWDAEDRATEWGGRLHVEVVDEDNSPVLDASYVIGSRDFTTVRTGDVVDTFYVLEVPFDEMYHVTDRMKVLPGSEMSVRLSFSFDNKVITSERFWWHAPSYVKVEAFHFDVEQGWLLYDVRLYDAGWMSTKWSGDLRIIVHDSLGAEMYNRSQPIVARDFNTMSWGDIGVAWYRGWVLFDDIMLSSDRIENGSGNGTGRWMRVLAWFEFDGVTIRQDPLGKTAVWNTHTIPQELLMPNEAPEARLVAERWGMTGREHLFNASGTRDDLGTDGLVYEWTWGDGSLTETTAEPFAEHTFARAGSFDVQLRVVDIEGASSSVNVSVEVLQEPDLDVNDLGEGELLDKVVGSYPASKLVDRGVLSDLTSRRPASR